MVFLMNGIDMTNEAWDNGAHRVSPIQQSNGNNKYVIPVSVSSAEGGTNNVVASFNLISGWIYLKIK